MAMDQAYSIVPTRTQLSTLGPDDGIEQLLIGRIGEQRYALPLRAVERILPMAALTPTPGAPPQIVGVLQVHSAILPVVDLHFCLGLPRPAFQPGQHLVVIAVGSRFLLWMDQVERIASVEQRDIDLIDLGGGAGPVAHMARLNGAIIPVLSVAALDPGPIIQPGETVRQ